MRFSPPTDAEIWYVQDGTCKYSGVICMWRPTGYIGQHVQAISMFKAASLVTELMAHTSLNGVTV